MSTNGAEHTGKHTDHPVPDAIPASSGTARHLDRVEAALTRLGWSWLTDTTNPGGGYFGDDGNGAVRVSRAWGPEWKDRGAWSYGLDGSRTFPTADECVLWVDAGCPAADAIPAELAERARGLGLYRDTEDDWCHATCANAPCGVVAYAGAYGAWRVNVTAQSFASEAVALTAACEWLEAQRPAPSAEPFVPVAEWHRCCHGLCTETATLGLPGGVPTRCAEHMPAPDADLMLAAASSPTAPATTAQAQEAPAAEDAAAGRGSGHPECDPCWHCGHACNQHGVVYGVVEACTGAGCPCRSFEAIPTPAEWTEMREALTRRTAEHDEQVARADRHTTTIADIERERAEVVALLGCPPEEADLLAHAKGIRFAADGYVEAINDLEAANRRILREQERADTAAEKTRALRDARDALQIRLDATEERLTEKDALVVAGLKECKRLEEKGREAVRRLAIVKLVVGS